MSSILQPRVTRPASSVEAKAEIMQGEGQDVQGQVQSQQFTSLSSSSPKICVK